MKKPKLYYSKRYYNLFEVLTYVDNKFPGFKRKLWKILCDNYEIHNDTMDDFNFDMLIDDDTPEIVVDGINYMYDEFPDIRDGEVEFWISW